MANLFLRGALIVILTAGHATAQTVVTQQELSDRIYENSFTEFHLSRDNAVSPPPDTALQIRLDECGIIVEWSDSKRAENIELVSLVTGDLASLVLRPQLDSKSFRFVSDGSVFENGRRIESGFILEHLDEMFSLKILKDEIDENGDRKVMMEHPFTSQISYWMPNIGSEEKLSALVQDLITYRDTFCSGAS